MQAAYKERNTESSEVFAK